MVTVRRKGSTSRRISWLVAIATVCVSSMATVVWFAGILNRSSYPDTSSMKQTPIITRASFQQTLNKAQSLPPPKPRGTVPPQDHTALQVDMISIGSKSRPRNVQEKTFARHIAVRHFWRFTEDQDTHDPDCAEKLSIQDVEAILDYCHANTTYPDLHLVSDHFSSRQFLLEKQKANPAGWLCAQKRPLVGLYRVLTERYSDPATLPDYLFLMDDDSWFHLDLVLDELTQKHPASHARVIAGCLIRSQYDLSFTWYWGGFGVILTRGAIERLRLPIRCNGDSSSFVKHACRQLQDNLLGERPFFKDGMTVAELIYQYSISQPYTKYKEWKTGYCVHSDMGLAYFFNYYHIADPSSQKAIDGEVAHYSRISAYNGTSEHKTKKLLGNVYKSFGFCKHKSLKTCSPDSHLCHYIPNKHMLDMFDQIYAASPDSFRDKAIVPEII